MQNIIIEKPYQFIPPHRGNWLPNMIQWFELYGRHLKQSEGVVDYECRGVERLQASLAAGHGILLTPNHSRTADPLVLGYLAKRCHTHVYAMASWHLFHKDRFTTWAIHKMGAFSVYREGVDRQAIDTAIEILEHAERPLIIFPEGATSRTNDRLHALLDGVAFIARVAAKKRAKQDPNKKVVVHPVVIKYLFGGDIKRVADNVLTDIEHRLSWQPQRNLPLFERLAKVGKALLTLKELEYFNEPKIGSIVERLPRLIDRLLGPLETEWLGAVQSGGAVPRVKSLRMKILPEMVGGKLPEDERNRRWRQLREIYLAQQLSCYPPDYLKTHLSVDRILETLERFEEDLFDKARVHGSMKAVMQVGEAIEVSPERDRTNKVDPVMTQLERTLQGMLDQLALESRMYAE